MRGRSAYVCFNREGVPGDWQVQVVKIVGGNGAATSWISFTDADGTVEPGLSFFEMNQRNTIARITDFWPEPCELSVSRAHLVERY